MFVQGILKEEKLAHPGRSYDERLIAYGVFLHDIGDRKYFPKEKPTGAENAENNQKFKSLLVKCGLEQSTKDSVAMDWLLSLDFPANFSKNVQLLCNCVSHFFELCNPETVAEALQKHPELAIVQDADRLDAIGAVGIGRVFAYTGAKGREGGLEGTLDHFEEKLYHIGAKMKTRTGRRLAEERTEKLRIFESWWREEKKL
jgi:uncharacterized protein